MKYTKTLGSIALSALLLGMTGCGSDNNTVIADTPVVDDTPVVIADTPVVAEETITPYTRVAVINDTTDVAGIADKIAHYVTLTDETADDGHDFPAPWVIAGANKKDSETYGPLDLLAIPSAGTDFGGKSRVIEFCNGKYATMATNTGRFHGSALPCEVSVHSDGTNTYVDMLDAHAIFSLFFTDIEDDAKAALGPVVTAVNGEIREMILAGLDDTTVAALSPTANNFGTTDEAAGITDAIPYIESTSALGPEFTQDDIDTEVALRNPYVVYKYKAANGNGTFVTADALDFAQEIIDTMGNEEQAGWTENTIYENVEGVSTGSGWKSARPHPLNIPGVKVVEACSGQYAKKATSLGNEYLTALPCEITVYVDETDDTNQTLSVSFLSPAFMFNTMFQGAVEAAYANEDINASQVIEYSTLPDVVFSDLRLIVDQAVKNLGGGQGHGGLVLHEALINQ